MSKKEEDKIYYYAGKYGLYLTMLYYITSTNSFLLEHPLKRSWRLSEISAREYSWLSHTRLSFVLSRRQVREIATRSDVSSKHYSFPMQVTTGIAK